MTIDDRRAAARDGGTAAAPLRGRPGWRQRLRTRIVDRGIQAMCGRTDDVTAAGVTDIPLLSGAARLAWLKTLGAVGIKNFVATSGLGYDFVCHTDDLANFPFFHPRAYRAELELCAAWLDGEVRPVVYDVGANGGFVATHLAQMLAGRAPRIYAFEPVPTTFAKLAQSVERLGLQEFVHPVRAAVVDSPGPVRISYSERNSLLAQVSPRGLNRRAGDRLAQATGITLDGFSASAGALPQLIKIDVEGSEASVLRGARSLLSRPDRPAILFEYNPVTLTECGASARILRELLSGYALHYVDDMRGQAIPFGGRIDALEAIDWICNLFAVPLAEHAAQRWAALLQRSAARSADAANPPS
jgi:FkbM family methyltransferase